MRPPYQVPLHEFSATLPACFNNVDISQHSKAMELGSWDGSGNTKHNGTTFGSNLSDISESHFFRPS